MGNGENNSSRSIWVKIDIAAKIAQIIFAVIVFPLVGFLYSLSVQMNEIKTQYAVVSATISSMPRFDDLKAKIAVIEDRQDALRLKVGEIDRDFQHHQLYSTYDPDSPNYNPRKNRMSK